MATVCCHYSLGFGFRGLRVSHRSHFELMSTPARSVASSRSSEANSTSSSKGSFSIAALKAKADAKALKKEMLQRAVDWCEENEVGPWQAAIEFPELTAHQIRYAMEKKKSTSRPQHDILTPIERERLVV